MKREDVTKIFEGATEEQVTSLLNIHSADIGNAKKALETERDSLKEQLKTAQDSETVRVREEKHREQELLLSPAEITGTVSPIYAGNRTDICTVAELEYPN